MNWQKKSKHINTFPALEQNIVSNIIQSFLTITSHKVEGADSGVSGYVQLQSQWTQGGLMLNAAVP